MIKGILGEPTVPKKCPYCGQSSKSWGNTVEHINRDHWKIKTNNLGEYYLGEYCGKCDRHFPSGRRTMMHILEKHPDSKEPTRFCEFPGCKVEFLPKVYGVEPYLCPDHERREPERGGMDLYANSPAESTGMFEGGR